MASATPGSGTRTSWRHGPALWLVWGTLSASACVDLTRPWDKAPGSDGAAGATGGDAAIAGGAGGALDAGAGGAPGSGGDPHRDVGQGGAGGAIDVARVEAAALDLAIDVSSAGGSGGSALDGGGGAAIDGGGGLGGGGGSDAPQGGAGCTFRDAKDVGGNDVADVALDVPADQEVDARDAISLPSGLLAYYPCESATGTVLPDLSGNHHDGTLAVGVALDGGTAGAGAGWSFAKGKVGNALVLAKAGYGYVELPPALFAGAMAITVAGWWKVTTAQNWQRMVDVGVNAHAQWNTLTGTKYFDLVPRTSASELAFAITVDGYGNEQTLVGDPVIETSGWKHVAVALDGSRGSLYVDGRQVALSTTVTLRPLDLGAIDYAFVGRSQWSADPYFDGQVDELRIYDRALSATEIQTLVQLTGP